MAAATSARAWGYIVAVTAFCGLALGFLLVTGAVELRVDVVAVLSMLSLLGIWWQVRHLAHHTGIGISSIVYLAAIPLGGAVAASLVGVISWALEPRRRLPSVRLFNASMNGCIGLLGGGAYWLCGGSYHLGQLTTSREVLADFVLPTLAANLTQCVANAALLAGVIALDQRAPWRHVFVGTLRGGGVAYVGYGIFGLLLAMLWDGAEIGPLSAVLVLAPLFVARWAFAQYAAEHLAHERTLAALIRAVETKDLYTRGHSERVARASVLIARVMGLSQERTGTLHFAGMLHDVGKLGVPTRVLQKSGALTDDEFATIALHPVRGLEMVREIEFLGEALKGILHHHERLDGRGYPMGLVGDAIPEFARIIAVADAFDSMTSTRSYRGARSVEEAVEELRRCAGTQFEHRFVEALVAALDREPWEPTTAPAAPVTPVAKRTGPAAVDHDEPSYEPRMASVADRGSDVPERRA